MKSCDGKSSSFASWFDQRATALVNDELAVPVTALENDLSELLSACEGFPAPDGTSVGRSKQVSCRQGAIQQIMAACTARRAEAEVRREVTARVRGSGRVPALAYTKPEVLAWLWESVAHRLDERIRALLPAAAPPKKRRRSGPEIALWPVVVTLQVLCFGSSCPQGPFWSSKT